MRKIIALFTLTLSFGFNANAQENTKSAPQQSSSLSISSPNESEVKEFAIKDIAELTKTIELQKDEQVNLINLLVLRTQDLSKLSDETEKKVLFEKYTEKLLVSLSEKQLEQLKKNKDLYMRLTQYTNK
jgi:ABC-type uncharacterized transport system permease subunit